nr:hypothetical protein [uncultured Sellimonas sp.]
MNKVRKDMIRSVPNLVVVCVEKYTGSAIQGNMYHPYSREAHPFQNEVQLIEQMEDFFDMISFPQAACELRKFGEQEKTRPQNDETSTDVREEILQKTGTCGTFLVRVQYRQNASWQGSILWKEKDVEQTFKSVLEFLMLLDNAVGGNA